MGDRGASTACSAVRGIGRAVRNVLVCFMGSLAGYRVGLFRFHRIAAATFEAVAFDDDSFVASRTGGPCSPLVSTTVDENGRRCFAIHREIHFLKEDDPFHGLLFNWIRRCFWNASSRASDEVSPFDHFVSASTIGFNFLAKSS